MVDLRSQLARLPFRKVANELLHPSEVVVESLSVHPSPFRDQLHRYGAAVDFEENRQQGVGQGVLRLIALFPHSSSKSIHIGDVSID